MGNSKMIEAFVADHREEFLSILEHVVNLESHTYGARETKNRCGLYLKELFEGLGFTVGTMDVGDVGIHVTGTYGSGTHKVLLVGHYDTVFPTGTTRERPFTVRDGKAFGPGIYDMKGGLISFYMAMKSLRELHMMPEDKEVTFFFNCDEEAGSGTSKDAIMALASQSDACLVAEPGHNAPGYVTAERFGRSVVEITARGEASHAGNRPDYAANPLLELSYLIIELESLCDKKRGVWYSPVSLHGGDVGATAMTPADASVIYDIRYLNEDLGREVEEVLHTLRPKLKNVHLEISGGREKPPFAQSEIHAKVYNRAKEIVEELGYPYQPARLGGGSDCNFTASVGCPSLCGLGLNGDFLHNPKEYVQIDTIPPRVALVAELIRTL